ncbi:adaptor protein MecA [Lachnospiraceae bacterium 45-P1]
MKIERINDNQIRCTLSNFDLSVRNLNLSELAYGSEKARNLFREMIQRASSEVGFEAEDIPLMVEAIPLANESVMLIITKIDDPEELDTRFSKFSQVEEDDENPWESLTSELLEGAENLMALLGNAEKQEKPEAAPKEVHSTLGSKKETPYVRIYQFASLDMVCAAARETGNIFNGVSILYKNPKNSLFYLVLKKESCDDLSFSRTCNILSEYGKRINQESGTEGYYAEHFELIVKKDALSSLSRL